MKIDEAANRLAECLASTQRRAVFAESCTAGLVAASLARIPGISAWLCGSAVTYRGDTKVQWLGVSERDIREQSAVCGDVARQMAMGVLFRTPEAHLACSVTGHLGPDAPPDLDGVVYIGVAERLDDELVERGVWRENLESEQRHARQLEATQAVLVRLGLAARARRELDSNP